MIVCGQDGYEIYAVPGWVLQHSDYSYGHEALSCRFAPDGHYAVGTK